LRNLVHLAAAVVPARRLARELAGDGKRGLGEARIGPAPLVFAGEVGGRLRDEPLAAFSFTDQAVSA